MVGVLSVALQCLLLVVGMAVARDWEIPPYWAVLLGWSLAALWDVVIRLLGKSP